MNTYTETNCAGCTPPPCKVPAVVGPLCISLIGTEVCTKPICGYLQGRCVAGVLVMSYYDGPGLTAVIIGTPATHVQVECPKWVNTATGVEYFRQLNQLCQPDGTAVVSILSWKESDAPGILPTVEYFNLNGTVYAGVVATLTRCAGEKVDIVSDSVCVPGVLPALGTTLERVSVFDVTGVAPVLTATLFRDNTGVVIAAPAVYNVGACAAPAVEFESLQFCLPITANPANGHSYSPAIRTRTFTNGVLTATEWTRPDGTVLALAPFEIGLAYAGACGVETYYTQVTTFTNDPAGAVPTGSRVAWTIRQRSGAPVVTISHPGLTPTTADSVFTLDPGETISSAGEGTSPYSDLTEDIVIDTTNASVRVVTTHKAT